MHIGLGSETGHYIALTRQNNKKWNICDDEKITQISQKKLKQMLDDPDPRTTPYTLLHHQNNEDKDTHSDTDTESDTESDNNEEAFENEVS